MKLFEHQKEGVDFLINRNGSGALFWEMGTGKTITAITAFDRMREKNPDLRLLVVAPLSLLHAAWTKDAAKIGTEFAVHNMHEDETLPKHYDILVINFEGLLGAKKRAVLESEAKKYPFMIVVDESSKMKNFKSKTTKALLEMSRLYKYRIVMSGTPAPNSEMEYWAQAEFVQPGIFFGHFFKFRNTFFHLQRGNQIQTGQFVTRAQAREIFSKGWKYSITQVNREKLMRTMSHIIHRKQKADCLDLPEQIDEIREVELTPAQAKIYKEMRTQLITEIRGKAITAPVALTKYMKLREITSGFAIDERETAHSIPGANRKLDELLDVLEEAGDQQAIIWGNFTWEIERIVEMLNEKFETRSAADLYPRPAVALYGKSTDRNEIIQDFIDGKIKYLVAHPRSAAHGLTFVNCSLQIFFSLDYSWETYEQARARTHRAGQKKTCVYVHLIAKNSVDQDILAVLKRKGDAQELLWGLK